MSAWHAILKMKIISVAVCTMGIAHTYMDQKTIQNECAACGIEHKVEAQGGLGIEKELTQEDVDSADIATVPMAALKKWLHHTLIDQGLASFEVDWKRSSRGLKRVNCPGIALSSAGVVLKRGIRMTNQELAKVANEVRKGVVTAVHAAKSGHPGGSLGAADIMTYLYFEEMDVDPANPNRAERDRFVLSKGHCAPALYAVLAERGFFPKEELETLRHIGSRLQGHPNMNDTPGIDMSTGSLGQGISAAVGMALAAKHWGDSYRVYTLLGDGECEEGQVWEAAMFAGNHDLDNLVAIVDHNGLQIDGSIDEVNSAMPLADKFRAFKWHVIELADGNDMAQIAAAFAEARKVSGSPVAIIAETVKGKGVSFMENQVGWHGKAPNDEQFEQAMAELVVAGEEL